MVAFKVSLYESDALVRGLSRLEVDISILAPIVELLSQTKEGAIRGSVAKPAIPSQ